MQSFNPGHPPPNLLQAVPMLGLSLGHITKRSIYSVSPQGTGGKDRCVMTNRQEPCVEGGAKARVSWLRSVTLVHFYGANSPISISSS